MLDDKDTLKKRWLQMINPHLLQVAQLPVARRIGLTTKTDNSAMRSLKQCIDKLDWPQQGRPTTIGEGKCLGITSLPAGGGMRVCPRWSYHIMQRRTYRIDQISQCNPSGSLWTQTVLLEQYTDQQKHYKYTAQGRSKCWSICYHDPRRI